MLMRNFVNEGVGPVALQTYCEHPQYWRPTMSVMQLWVLSAVSWADLTSVGWVELTLATPLFAQQLAC